MDGDDDSIELLGGEGSGVVVRGGGGGAVPHFSPSTQEHYERINEEFDHVLHSEVVNKNYFYVPRLIIINFVLCYYPTYLLRLILREDFIFCKFINAPVFRYKVGLNKKCL